MLVKYKGGGQFLSAFSQFGVKRRAQVFNGRGVATKEESGREEFSRFPTKRNLFWTLVQYMKEGKVKAQTGVAVADISIDKFTKFLIYTA